MRVQPLSRPSWLPRRVWPFETFGIETDEALLAVTEAGSGPTLVFVHVGAWPVFNVADASISVSIVAVLLFFGLQDFERARKPKPADDGGRDAGRDG